MLVLCPDLKERLHAVGYTSYTARNSKTMSPVTYLALTKAAKDQTPVSISGDVLNALCIILDCQPSDLIKYVEDPEELAQFSSKWPDLHRDAREAAARSELEARIADLQGQLARMESGRDPQVRE